MNLCGCRHAKPDNSGGGMTWNYVCKLTGDATDPNMCAKCPDKTEKKKVEGE